MGTCRTCKHIIEDAEKEPCRSCALKNGGTMSHWEAIPPEYDPAEVAFSKVQDSGERKEFSTGAKRDIQEGKGRCDLLPLDVIANVLNNEPHGNPNAVLKCIQRFVEEKTAYHLYDALESFCTEREWNFPEMLLELAVHFEEGNKKYPPGEDGVANWKLGIPVHSYIDSSVRHYLKYRRGDTDERHDRAFCWNVVCCIWTMIHKPEMNDLPQIKNGKL